MNGANPFELKNKEKNVENLKQEQRKQKNEDRKKGLKPNKNIKNISNNNSENTKSDNKDKFLGRKIGRKQVNDRLKSENKALGSTLEIAQKSSGSMGKFDKKIKNEKAINTLKKNKIKHEVLTNRNSEKSRDKSIMENILRTSNKK